MPFARKWLWRRLAVCSFVIAIGSWGQAQTTPDIQTPSSQTPSSQTPSSPETVPLLHDYDEAVARSEKMGRPLVVVLGADWCGPCKLLEKELEQPTALPIFQGWVVVKVDVDQEVGLARQWMVTAVPAFRILDIDQDVLASNEGLSTVKKLRAWLDENFEAANPKTQRLMRDDKPLDSHAVGELIAMLRDRRPTMRTKISEKLAKNKVQSVRLLVATLSSGNLSQKLGALEILEKWSAPLAGIDPWEPDTITGQRLAELDDWLQAVVRP